MIKKLITAPLAPAVTVDDIKYHLRIDPYDFDHDDRIEPYLYSAIAVVEELTGRALITQTWELMFERWVDLRMAVVSIGWLQEVSYIEYRDENGVTQTVLTDDYIVDKVGTDEGRIIFHSGSNFDFPDLWDADPITVGVVVGYGNTSLSVPVSIQSAIKLMVSDMENGSDSSQAIYSLLNPYRIWRI